MAKVATSFLLQILSVETHNNRTKVTRKPPWRPLFLNALRAISDGIALLRSAAARALATQHAHFKAIFVHIAGITREFL